jgi:hypothetical protein
MRRGSGSRWLGAGCRRGCSRAHRSATWPASLAYGHHAATAVRTADVHMREWERGGGGLGWLRSWAEIGGLRPNSKRNSFLFL